jgi:hypothetical protein
MILPEFLGEKLIAYTAENIVKIEDVRIKGVVVNLVE